MARFGGRREAAIGRFCAANRAAVDPKSRVTHQQQFPVGFFLPDSSHNLATSPNLGRRVVN